MIVHILDLPFHIAVYAFAVRPIGQLAHHAKPIWPFLSRKELLDRYSNPLPSSLPAYTDHFLFQPDFGWRRGSFLGLSPASL